MKYLQIIFAVLILSLMVTAWTLAAPVSKIQMRRGTEANLPTKLANGEPAVTTDTHRFFVGYSTGMEEYLQRARFLGYTAVTAQRLAALWSELDRQDTSIATKHDQEAHERYSTIVAGQLAGKVSTTDSRLSDARTPTDHTQAASTITGLGAVATTNNYTSLTDKPTIPAAQVPADWNSIINPTQILNKPVIPVVCGTDPETAVFDGAQGIQGEQGIQGATGATGAAGTNGTDGVTWDFVVGAVENLPNGSVPYVNYTTSGPTTKTVNYGVVQGADGSASITKNDVFNTIAATPSVDKFILRSNSADTDVLMEIKDVSVGNVRLYVTGSGLLFIKDANGKLIGGFDAPNQKFIMSNYSVGSTRKNFEVDRYGQITRYAPNGTSVVYRDYTSGRATWYSKSGRVIMQRYTGALVL